MKPLVGHDAPVVAATFSSKHSCIYTMWVRNVALIAESAATLLVGWKGKTKKEIDFHFAVLCSSWIPLFCVVFSSEDLTLGVWQVAKEKEGEIGDVVPIKFPSAALENSEQILLPILELNVSENEWKHS